MTKFWYIAGMTQKEAMAVLKSGLNVYLTGPAGSGKTHLLREFIAELKNRSRSVAVTASTGIAATHLDGITVHSWSGIGVTNTLSPEDIKRIINVPRLARRFRNAEVLIIDEISMLHHFQLDLVSEVLRTARSNWLPFGGIQVVLCGDFFQLPPVSRHSEASGKFAYEAAAWNEADFKICYLEEQFRQSDLAMIRILNDIRERRVSIETKELLLTRYRQPIVGVQKPTRLFPHNERVDSVNELELSKLPGDAQTYMMGARGKEKEVKFLKQSCLAPEVLAVKQGARIMFVKNNFETGYANGTTGEVIGFEEGYPLVKTKNGTRIVARPVQWKLDDGVRVLAEISQVPLRLAWAITVHKSQGLSLDAAETDLSRTFVPGMGYVALSRVRTLDGLSLLGMNSLAFQVEEKICEVDQKMKTDSEKFHRSFTPGHSSDDSRKIKTSRPFEKIRAKFPNAYRSWTTEEEVKLTEGYRSGLSVKELAGLHGRKLGGVRARLKRLGL